MERVTNDVAKVQLELEMLKDEMYVIYIMIERVQQ